MGRSRAGLTTKIHAVADARGRPIRLKLTEGQAHDGRSGRDMVETVGEGQTLLADRGYDRDRLRDRLAARGAGANIRPMPPQKRFPAFDPILYPPPQPNRAVLQQNRILPNPRNPIRQTRRQLPRLRPTRFFAHSVAHI
jgi:transposase